MKEMNRVPFAVFGCCASLLLLTMITRLTSPTRKPSDAPERQTRVTEAVRRDDHAKVMDELQPLLVNYRANPAAFRYADIRGLMGYLISMNLLRAEHAIQQNQPQQAQRYFQQAEELLARSPVTTLNDPLSRDGLNIAQRQLQRVRARIQALR
jgi:hypothetical protein